MAGTVKQVLVKEGDIVGEGKDLVVLESMKMENRITATAPGTVKAIHVKTEDSVREGQVLLVVN